MSIIYQLFTLKSFYCDVISYGIDHSEDFILGETTSAVSPVNVFKGGDVLADREPALFADQFPRDPVGCSEVVIILTAKLVAIARVSSLYSNCLNKAFFLYVKKKAYTCIISS